jgi:DNA-binding NarL/FixJ family response regulator
VRVVIAEDLFLLREGLASFLKDHGFEIAEAVGSGPELARALSFHQPDVSIIDIRLPPTYTDEGLRAALDARRQLPGLPVLILSAHVEQLYARELLADPAGGVGYLLKDRVFTDEQFTDALRTVARGGTVMDPDVVAKLLARRDRQALGRLTPRERDVLALMAEGRSNSAIAQRLFVSEKAVSKHSTSIFAKLDLLPSDDDNRRVRAVLAYLNELILATAVSISAGISGWTGSGSASTSAADSQACLSMLACSHSSCPAKLTSPDVTATAKNVCPCTIRRPPQENSIVLLASGSPSSAGSTSMPASSLSSRAAASASDSPSSAAPPTVNQKDCSGRAGSQPCSRRTRPSGATGSTRAVVRWMVPPTGGHSGGADSGGVTLTPRSSRWESPVCRGHRLPSAPG